MLVEIYHIGIDRLFHWVQHKTQSERQLLPVSKIIFNLQILVIFFLVITSTRLLLSMTVTFYMKVLRTPLRLEILQSFLYKIITSISILGFISASCLAIILQRKTTKNLVNDVVSDYSLLPVTRLQAKMLMHVIDSWPLKIKINSMFSINFLIYFWYIYHLFPFR